MSTQMQRVHDRLGMIGNVMVFGVDLLHPKQLEIIEYALMDQPDNNLQALFIVDENLDGHVGEYCRSTRSAAISLKEIAEDAISSEDFGLSLSARVWVGFIYTLYHELHHNVALAMAQGDQGDGWKDFEEEQAKIFAQEKIEPTIIECSAEVPPTDEHPAFYRVMQFMIDELKANPDSEWVRTQKNRLDEGIVFESKDDIYDSIVEYFKATSETPEKYEKENGGATVVMVQETMPNLFDQKVLPGHQATLFPDNKPPLTTCGDLGSTLSAVQAQLNTTHPDSIEMIEDDENIQPNPEQQEEYRISNEESDVDDDNLPPEAYDGNDGDGIIPNDDGSVTYVTDPFAPSFTPTQLTTAESQAAAVKQEATVNTPIQTGLRDVLINLYMRMYHHMWTAGVLEPLYLTETEKACGLVVGCIVSNGDGGWITGDVTKAGYIKGCMYRNGTLPAYDLLLNWGGIELRYKMIAQNPDKASSYGEQARNGAKIVWILDAKEEDKRKSFKSKIINGVYSAC